MADFWLNSILDGQENRFQLRPPGPVTIGRAATCTLVWDNKSVSRTHARLEWVAATNGQSEHWQVFDAGSSVGTIVNRKKLEGTAGCAVQHGDVLSLGPWQLEVVDREVGEGSMDASRANATLMNFETVKSAKAAEFGHAHLALLLEASAAIHKSTDEASTQRTLVHSVAQATGFENVAFVCRTDVGDGVQVLEHIGDVKDATGGHRMSRSMLRKASDGMVIVSDAEQSSESAIAASLLNRKVHSAICIPLVWDRTNFGFLYLDNGQTRGDGRDKERLTEAAKVSDALARIAAQNLSNLRHGKEMEVLWRSTLQMIVDLIEGRDPYTGGHSRRVAEFSRLLCQAAGMDDQMVSLIYQCGRVHDIGKICVDDAVLRKTGPLTDEEFAMIARHPEAGHKILKEHPQMHAVLRGVLEHHEKWNGTGYPNKLAGEGISQMGRIICIADCFDAMTSDRPYRKAFSFEVAMGKIEKDSGTHFDPDLVKAFIAIPRTKIEEHMPRPDGGTPA